MEQQSLIQKPESVDSDSLTHRAIAVLKEQPITLGFDNSQQSAKRTPGSGLPAFLLKILFLLFAGALLGALYQSNLLNRIKIFLMEQFYSELNSGPLSTLKPVERGLVLISAGLLAALLLLIPTYFRNRRRQQLALEARLAALSQLIQETESVIWKLEQRLGRCAVNISAAGLDNLAKARRIVRSLEDRLRILLEKSSHGRIVEALSLTEAELEFSESRVDSLISYPPLAAIPAAEILPTLRDIFSEVRSGLRKAA